MSTSQRPDQDAGDTATSAEPVRTEPYVHRAEHLGAEFERPISACLEASREPGDLTHVAHYSSGIFDFSIDWLNQPPRPPDPGMRDRLQRLGRALSFTASRLDRNLQEARTGGLIRAVLQTDRGAAYCNTVVPKENVVGLVLAKPTTPAPDESPPEVDSIRAGDRTMAGIATRLRRLISLNSSNPGGWQDTEEPALEPTEPASEPHVTIATPPDKRDAVVLSACRDAVRPADLHFVAYYPDGEPAYLADHFEDRSLGPFFTQITATARRKFYQEFGREVGALATTLRRTVRGVLGDRLVRMVLDVEQGGVFYYRVHGRTYLIGVTVDQSRIRHADDRLAKLTRTIQRLRTR